jgi:hypothetical protein
MDGDTATMAMEEEHPSRAGKGEPGLPRHEVKFRGNAGGYRGYNKRTHQGMRPE